MTARVRRARVAATTALATAMLVALALVPACKKTPTLDFSLSLPNDVASKVAWFEVGVFPGPACNSLNPQLAGGVPAEGYVKRVAFKAHDLTPPLLQNLPRAKYAIAVAARAADCSVVASGCSDVDLSSIKSVDVLLNDDATPAEGACIDGAVCNDGRCTPGTNNDDPSVGAGCSLAFLGAGPLADPLLLGGGTVVSAPAIAATDRGFLVAYREYDVADGVARITAIPIDQGGGAFAAKQTTENACQQSQLSDATGMVFSADGTTGTILEARAGCGGEGGLDFFTVDDTGVFGKGGFVSEGQPRVLFSTAHALASSSAGTFVAYLQSNAAMVAQVTGHAVSAGPTPFGGAGRSTQAWVAASDRVVALVSAGQGDGTTTGNDAGPPNGIDAGDDAAASEAGAGDDAGSTPDAGAPVVDASLPPGSGPGTGSVIRVNVIATSDAGTPLDSFDPPAAFVGNWASVSAQSGRVFVASDGQTSEKPIAYRAFDVGKTAPSITDGFTTADLGPVLYTDVAFHQDHVFFAVERPGSLALVAFDHATTTPSILRVVELATNPRVPSLSGIRDGRVAVLATNTRVIVAWTTQEVLTSNDATGGYAVFACTTP